VTVTGRWFLIGVVALYSVEEGPKPNSANAFLLRLAGLLVQAKQLSLE